MHRMRLAVLFTGTLYRRGSGCLLVAMVVTMAIVLVAAEAPIGGRSNTEDTDEEYEEGADEHSEETVVEEGRVHD